MVARSYLAPTKRRPMTKARRVGIFLARDGRCGICGMRVGAGEQYHIEHPSALALGGSDNDADLWPVHIRCHAVKTPADRRLIAKRNSIIDQGYVGPEKRKRVMPGSRASEWKRKFNGQAERRT